MIIMRQAPIELRPGDKVVAACPHRDEIVIVTERGEVYRIYREESDR